jgi:FAD/FMN-containing dehydrogenase
VPYESFEDVVENFPRFIEEIYNKRQLHSACGYLSPQQIEDQHTRQATAAGTITVRAGMTLEAVQTAAQAAGLFFALDLGSRGSCTIGGNLSTNAGGNRVIRYGMARDLTLGIEVALSDGTLLTSLNKMVKNNAGYDLKQLFIGSEGTLGVITRAVLRLHAQPPHVAAALCGLASYAKVVGHRQVND